MEPFAKKVHGFKPSTIFAECSILDVLQGSEYASVYNSLKYQHYLELCEILSPASIVIRELLQELLQVTSSLNIKTFVKQTQDKILYPTRDTYQFKASSIMEISIFFPLTFKGTLMQT